jgi:hypothetical protein
MKYENGKKKRERGLVPLITLLPRAEQRWERTEQEKEKERKKGEIIYLVHPHVHSVSCFINCIKIKKLPASFVRKNEKEKNHHRPP